MNTSLLDDSLPAGSVFEESDELPMFIRMGLQISDSSSDSQGSVSVSLVVDSSVVSSLIHQSSSVEVDSSSGFVFIMNIHSVVGIDHSEVIGHVSVIISLGDSVMSVRESPDLFSVVE